MSTDEINIYLQVVRACVVSTDNPRQMEGGPKAIVAISQL